MAYYVNITPQPLVNHENDEEHERIFQEHVLKAIRSVVAMNNLTMIDLDEYERQAKVGYDYIFRTVLRERPYEEVFCPLMSKEPPSEPMTRHLPMPTSCYLSPLEQDVKPPAMQVQSTLPKQPVYPGLPMPLSFATPRMPPPLPPLPTALACGTPKPPAFPTLPKPPGFPTLPQPPVCSTLAKPPAFSSSMSLPIHQSG